MSDGERMVWAAVFAGDYGRTGNTGSAIASACLAIFAMRNLNSFATSITDERDVFKMLAEMCGKSIDETRSMVAATSKQSTPEKGNE